MVRGTVFPSLGTVGSTGYLSKLKRKEPGISCPGDDIVLGYTYIPTGVSTTRCATKYEASIIFKRKEDKLGMPDWRTSWTQVQEPLSRLVGCGACWWHSSSWCCFFVQVSRFLEAGSFFSFVWVCFTYWVFSGCAIVLTCLVTSLHIMVCNLRVLFFCP